jgi:anti-sigma factor RsiW
VDLTSHGTDDQLELYALGQLPSSQVIVLEEHLLACPACLERLEEAENWAIAAREVLSQDPAPVAKAATKWFTWPRFAWAGVALAVLALAIGIGLSSRGGVKLAPVASLQLTAMRGEMDTVDPANEFDLTLTDAPPSSALQVRLVDAAGASIWNGRTNGVQVRIKRALKAGTYFVRVYGADGQMLHEYGFRVRG